jgi:hypothetical protein
MSFTVPRDAPVSFVESTSGRPEVRSMRLAQVVGTYGSADSNSPVARSSVYTKPFLSKWTSTLRFCPLRVSSVRIISWVES